MNSTPQTILVLHVAGLSGTTLGLPALRSLRAHFPASLVSIVASSHAVELLTLGNCADAIMPVARLRREMFSPALLYRGLQTLQSLRRSNFDLVVELSSSPESPLLLQIINASERLQGSTTESKRGLLSRIANATAAFTKPPRVQLHLAQRYLQRLESLGVRPIEAAPRITTDREADVKLEKWLEKNGMNFGDLLVGIHPGAGRKTERWPVERFTSIATRLIHNFNARIIVISGPYERGVARRMVKMLPAGRAVSLQSPRIPDLVSVLARLSVLVGNHSGPAHVAAAVGTPVVVASAMATPSEVDLLSKNHISIKRSSAQSIPEEELYDAACRLIKRNRSEMLRAF